jgi:hypothetical protein
MDVPMKINAFPALAKVASPPSSVCAEAMMISKPVMLLCEASECDFHSFLTQHLFSS